MQTNQALLSVWELLCQLAVQRFSGCNDINNNNNLNFINRVVIKEIFVCDESDLSPASNEHGDSGYNQQELWLQPTGYNQQQNDVMQIEYGMVSQVLNTAVLIATNRKIT